MFCRIASLVLAFGGFASANAAEACPSFGFASPYLSELFCQQINEITEPRTRDIGDWSPDSADLGALAPPSDDWMAFPEIREAWRSDPAKTLKLIARIRDAGGRPIK